MNKAVLFSTSITAHRRGTIAIFGSVVAQAASPPNVVGQKYSDALLSSPRPACRSWCPPRWAIRVARPSCIVTRQQCRTEAAPGEHERLAGRPSASLAQLRSAGGLGDILWQLARKS